MQVYVDLNSSLSFWWPGPLLSYPVYLAISIRFFHLDIPKGICEVSYSGWDMQMCHTLTLRVRTLFVSSGLRKHYHSWSLYRLIVCLRYEYLGHRHSWGDLNFP